MAALIGLLLREVLGPVLLSGLKMLLDGLIGWMAAKQAAATNVALGQQTARADRLAAEAALNKERQDAEARARAESDDALRDRLRRSLGRPAGDPGGRPG